MARKYRVKITLRDEPIEVDEPELAVLRGQGLIEGEPELIPAAQQVPAAAAVPKNAPAGAGTGEGSDSKEKTS